MAHAQIPDLVFQRNGRVHLYRRGCQFSRLLAAEVCASAVVMLDRPFSDTVHECWLPTPFTSFPFTSPPVLRRVPSDSVFTLPNRLFHYYTQTDNDEHFAWRVVNENTLRMFSGLLLYGTSPLALTFIRYTYVINHTQRTLCDMTTKILRAFATECSFTHCIYISTYV